MKTHMLFAFASFFAAMGSLHAPSVSLRPHLVVIAAQPGQA
jgi:hypothetical protein